MSWETDVEKARAVVAEWEAKADTARAEAERVDADAGAEILADPRSAERITIKVEAKRREARAYDSAAAEARARVADVYRKHVEAEARALEKQAAAKRRDVEKHRAKVDGLLDQLRKLDGVPYDPVRGALPHMEGTVFRAAVDGPSRTRSEELDEEAAEVEAQAEVVRFVLEHGRRPRPGDDAPYAIALPPVTQAALDVGVMFA